MNIREARQTERDVKTILVGRLRDQAQTDEEAPGGFAAPDTGDLRAFIELVRSDIRTEKAFILAQIK